MPKNIHHDMFAPFLGSAGALTTATAKVTQLASRLRSVGEGFGTMAGEIVRLGVATQSLIKLHQALSSTIRASFGRRGRRHRGETSRVSDEIPAKVPAIGAFMPVQPLGGETKRLRDIIGRTPIHEPYAKGKAGTIGSSLDDLAPSETKSAPGATNNRSITSFRIAREWSALSDAIEKAGFAAFRKSAATLSQARSFQEDHARTQWMDPSANDIGSRPSSMYRSYGSAASSFDSALISANGKRASKPLQLWDGIPVRKYKQRNTAATVSAGLPFAAPATRAIALRESNPVPDPAANTAMNSNPEIVGNAASSDDIEERVLSILYHHREAIYAQWSRELQRRQRTEF